MSEFMKRLAKRCAEKIYRVFESDSGNMIMITTATGVFLSTLAQSLAIVGNKKYSVSQKAFMIPQEITEGAISIGSLLITTLIMKKSADKFVESGKIITKDLKSYLKKNNVIKDFGSLDYSVSRNISGIINDLEKSTEYINASKEKQKAMITPHKNAMLAYEQTKDAASAIVTTTGSVLSTALFVPLIRNYVASEFQPANIVIINDVRKRKEEFKKQRIMLNNRRYGTFKNPDMRI